MFAKKVALKQWVLPTAYSNLSQYERAEVRLEYITRQKGKCHHCGSYLADDPSSVMRCQRVTTSLFPSGFFESPVHLHHDHCTDMTIGAVHCHCNAVLWEYHGE
jgi:hypothetical protein